MTSGHSHVTRNVIWSDLPRLDTSAKAEQVRYMILIRLYNSNNTLPYRHKERHKNSHAYYTKDMRAGVWNGYEICGCLSWTMCKS